MVNLGADLGRIEFAAFLRRAAAPGPAVAMLESRDSVLSAADRRAARIPAVAGRELIPSASFRRGPLHKVKKNSENSRWRLCSGGCQPRHVQQSPHNVRLFQRAGGGPPLRMWRSPRRGQNLQKIFQSRSINQNKKKYFKTLNKNSNKWLGFLPSSACLPSLA